MEPTTSQSHSKGFKDLPPELLPTILAFVPCPKARLRLAIVAKGWLAALASSDSYSHDCSAEVGFLGPDAPLLQQDLLAALAASGTAFCLDRRLTSWAWLPSTIRRLALPGRMPADCPTLACVENVHVQYEHGDSPVMDVTRFPSTSVLKASFADLSHCELETISWLEKLAAFPQLAEVALHWGSHRPCRFLTQLPVGCKLSIITTGRTPSESLPHRAILARLVTLHVYALYNPIQFSCLASCPNLRYMYVRLDIHDVECFLAWGLPCVDLSTLSCVPACCSVVLGFKNACMHMSSFQPPVGWNVAPCSTSSDKLLFSRNGSQD